MDRRTCVISVHYNNNDFHKLTKNPMKTFDLELSQQMEVVIIEKVDFGNRLGDEKSRFLREREFYWQTQLNTFESFGGLNKRDPRDEIRQS